MVDEKWYLNKTVIGVIVGFIALLLANFGYTMSSEQGTEITNTIVVLIQAISGLVGIILVIWGKIKAGREIKTLKMQVRKLGGTFPTGDDLHCC